MKAATEADLLKQVKLYLELKDVLVIRVNSGAFAGNHQGKKRFVRMNSEPGCSDLLACHNGRFLALEVKRPGNKASAAQASFLQAVSERGGLAAVVTSIEDVAAVLEQNRTGGLGPPAL